MRIGLIDVDNTGYPNLSLMKLSAYHKKQGDNVEWYEPFNGMVDEYDMVYMSKVFSFSEDYQAPIYAKKVVKGGTGYCIETVNGKEIYHKELNKELPYEIEHIYPDYSLYPEKTKDTAYGFLTRGCPRGCNFCIVKDKEGLTSHKVANLNEFWNGQKNIILFDQNILACKDCEDLLQQLIDSGATVDLNQGIDIRLMTEKKAKMLSQIKMKQLHFAYDRIEDKEMVERGLLEFKKYTNIGQHNLIVMMIVGDREPKVLESDLYRIYWLRDNGYAPYVMLYDKYDLPRGHELKKLQRWVNNRFIFWKVPTFEEYLNKSNLEK